MLTKCAIILSLYSLSSTTYAQKLLKCASSGGAWTKCKLAEEFTLAKKTTFLWAPESCALNYFLSYTFQCAGNVHGLTFSAGHSTKPILYTSSGASRSETLSGPNDLSVVDINPKLTRSASFFGECALSVSSLRSVPSDKCIDEMNAAIASEHEEAMTLEKDLVFYNNTLKAIDQYCLFSSAYYLFESLGNFFISQLSDPIRIQIKHKIESVLPTLATMSKNEAFTTSQRMAFFNIQFLASQMDDPSVYLNENGTPKKLKDFLTLEDKDVIDEMAKLNLLSDLERENLKDQILRKIGSTEEKIAELNRKHSAWKEAMEREHAK